MRIILSLFLLVLIGFTGLALSSTHIKATLVLAFVIAGLFLVVFGLLGATIYMMGRSHGPRYEYHYHVGWAQMQPGGTPGPRSGAFEGRYRELPADIRDIAGPFDRIVRQEQAGEPKIIGGLPDPYEESACAALAVHDEVERYDWDRELPFDGIGHGNDHRPPADGQVGAATDPVQAVYDFLCAWTEPDPDSRIPARYLYEEMFAEWCADQGVPRISATMFGRVMGEHGPDWGIRRVEEGNGRFYIGIRESV